MANFWMPGMPGMHKFHLIVKKRRGETRELAIWEKRTEAENTDKNRNQCRSRKEL